MKWNITFIITGPSGRVVEAPNNTNPVEADTLEEVLAHLVKELPIKGPATMVGIRIHRTDIDPDSIEV